MKRAILSLTLPLLLVTAVVLTGCSPGGAQVQTGKSTIEVVKSKGELVVGTAPGYFPFEMVDKQGNIVGFDIEVAQAIAKQLGVKLRVERFSFDGLIPALQTGKVDMVIAGMTIRGDRALSVSFSDPYYVTGQVLMVSNRNPGVKSWKDLDVKGKVIGVSLGTTGAMLAKELFKNAEVKDFDTFPDACLAASTGKADAVVYDEPGIRVYVARHPESVYGVWELLSAENLGIAVRKDDFSTVQWLRSFLESYVGSPEYKSAVTRWFEKMDWLESVDVK
jgi:polar amino acid transport system substrate-binding protein